MQRCPLGSAGRPVIGRPAAATVVALIAMLAVGAPAALAGDIPAQPVVPPVPAAQVEIPAVEVPEVELPPVEVPPVEVPPVEVPPVEVPPVEVPEVAQPSVEPPHVEQPPVEPPQVEVPPVEPSPVQPPPADPPRADPLPMDSPAPGPPAPRPAQPVPSPPSSGGGHGELTDQGAVAENVNRVIQAVWQVQRGCRSYCYGTSQTQSSTQWSHTTQSATSVAGGAGAAARNQSSTSQFVWQLQIGCVAFCFDTSQTQEASQRSHTGQEALAESSLTAWAENIAETIQWVFQVQRGCEHECHGTHQSQSMTQANTTTQSATAMTEGDDGSMLLPDWLLAYASNVGATIQMIHQYQDALCLEHCVGDTQSQEALQAAETIQLAVALANPPPPPVEPPAVESPPAEPPAGPTAPEGGAPAVPAAGTTGSAIRRHVVVIGRKRKGSVRRQEIVLRVSGSVRTRTRVSSHAFAGASATLSQTSRSGGEASQGPARSAPGAADRAGGDILGQRQTARTLVAPPDPSDGGSVSWLAIALLAAALGFIAGLIRLLAFHLRPGV